MIRAQCAWSTIEVRKKCQLTHGSACRPWDALWLWVSECYNQFIDNNNQRGKKASFLQWVKTTFNLSDNTHEDMTKKYKRKKQQFLYMPTTASAAATITKKCTLNNNDLGMWEFKKIMKIENSVSNWKLLIIFEELVLMRSITRNKMSWWHAAHNSLSLSLSQFNPFLPEFFDSTHSSTVESINDENRNVNEEIVEAFRSTLNVFGHKTVWTSSFSNMPQHKLNYGVTTFGHTY